VDWFYRLWVVPIAGLTWFGIAIAMCFVFLPLGILALIFAAILFEGLLRHRSAEKPGSGEPKQPTP
jgi:hypothetical protein